jgi:hypothetical protein
MSGGNFSFSKDPSLCDVKGCNKEEDGLCIHRHDLHKILEDPKMPKEVKREVN